MNKIKISLGILLVSIAGVIAWGVLGPSEPSYGGRPLSYWLEVHSSKKPASSSREAELAIRKIGTKAIPFLMRDLRFHKTSTSMRLWSIVQRLGFVHPRTGSYYDRGDEAVAAFALLGGDAGLTVPALIQILQCDSSLEVRCRCLVILGNIGPQAVPAVPALLQALKDSTNALVRINASAALERIHGDAPSVVPALVKCLHDPDEFVRLNAIRALGKFGPEGKPAVLDLRKLARNDKVDSPLPRSVPPPKDDPANFMLVPMFIPKPGDDARSAAAALRAIEPGGTNASMESPR